MTDSRDIADDAHRFAGCLGALIFWILLSVLVGGAFVAWVGVSLVGTIPTTTANRMALSLFIVFIVGNAVLSSVLFLMLYMSLQHLVRTNAAIVELLSMRRTAPTRNESVAPDAPRNWQPLPRIKSKRNYIYDDQ